MSGGKVYGALGAVPALLHTVEWGWLGPMRVLEIQGRSQFEQTRRNSGPQLMTWASVCGGVKIMHFFFPQLFFFLATSCVPCSSQSLSFVYQDAFSLPSSIDFGGQSRQWREKKSWIFVRLRFSQVTGKHPESPNVKLRKAVGLYRGACFRDGRVLPGASLRLPKC